MQYNLVFSTDNNYLPYLLVVTQSILDNIEPRESNLHDKLIFNILVDNTVDLPTTQNKIKLFAERNSGCGINFQFVWHLVNSSDFKDFNPLIRDGKAALSAYYRVILDRFLPQDVSYAAYLDIDMLVIRDIRDLFERYPLEGKILGAVIDPGISNFRLKYNSESFVHCYYKNSKTDFIKIPKERYFNSGLLLFNLNEWRKQNLADKCLDLACKLDLELHDQDLLNYICQEQVELIDLGWNFQPAMFYVLYNKDTDKYDIASALTLDKHWITLTPSAEDFEKSAASPYIIHFNGSKPWNYESTFNVPFASNIPDSPKLAFYKQKWFLTRQRITEYPHCHNLNMDAIDYASLEVYKTNKKRRKDRKLLVSLITFSLILNILTIILSLLDVI